MTECTVSERHYTMLLSRNCHRSSEDASSVKRARQSDPGPRFRELVLAYVCQQGLCFDQ